MLNVNKFEIVSPRWPGNVNKTDFKKQKICRFSSVIRCSRLELSMPSKTSTNSLKDKLDDDTLDLSLMQLTEVPVEEIVSRTELLISNCKINPTTSHTNSRPK